MNFIITKNSVFEDVRVLEIQGEAWFVGKDVCRVFGDTDHKRSLARLDSDEKSTAIITDSLGRKQSATIINESGLYSLIFSFEPSKARKDGGGRYDR